MPKAKKKRLPRDFEALLAQADLAALQGVFDECEVDARGGYGKQTALAFSECPDELARWLVARGADLSAADTWGNTPLHERARSHRSAIDVLLELGADVHAAGASVGTPLHAAAHSKQVAHAATLLAHGAQVDARNRDGLTPLELALRGCSNAEIDRMLEVARVLLDAGAARTPATAAYVEEIGKRFEFHRAGFAKDSVAAVSAALDGLYALFGVAPVARREIHDGRTAIAVKSSAWQDQHEELWNLLVPSSGPALTVQGEAIRISGRLSHEVLDNGGANWNDDFRTMARALLTYVQTGTPLAEPEIARVRAAIDEIADRGDGETAPLAELAVAWVLRNPSPVPLGKVAYSR
jgi:ankyrin repeat protein